jgi:FixJ family two-component response regulator
MSPVLERANYTVRSFSSPEALLAAGDDRSMGILILDPSLVDMSATALQNELNTQGIGLKIIFISDAGTIEMSVQAIKAGAINFIEKPFSARQLLYSVDEARTVAIDEEKQRRKHSLHRKRYEQLTRRELEVMNFIIRGDTSRKLAERMGLSSRTVEVHRANIMRKLEASSLPDLVCMACMHSDLHPGEVLVDIRRSLNHQKHGVA